MLVSLIPASASAGVFISVGFAPPALPVYVQPPCPEDGLMWVPGYWHYGDEGYYWVPGAWVPAPAPGLLWTPGYWGWGGGVYVFHEGYWGPHVGYYGGVNYGFGYMGVGFAGGEWRGGHFAYNTAIVNVNTTVIHNTYVNTTIVHNTTIINNTHVAYSGGPGGIQHQPTPEEKVAEHETHQAPSPVQQQHIQQARSNPASFAKNNGGKPATAAVARPLSPSHPLPPAPVHPNAEAAAVKSHSNTNNNRAETPAPHASPAVEAPRGGKSSTDDWTQKTAAPPPAHPAPQSRPVPESRPAPQSHPAPQAHPAPQSHPAPREPEPKKK
jgi:hypothetical protein